MTEQLPGRLPGRPDAIRGRVERWDDEEGWGVLAAPATPGGCFAHFSAIDAPGYRSLAPGADVWFAYRPADQDGHRFQATWVRVATRP